MPNDLPLKDLHLPEAISWWPPAIGWWLLAALIILTIAFGYWLFKRLTRKTPVKAAKKLLAQLQQNTQMDGLQKVAQLSILLRRVAISTAVTDVAGLTNQAWLAYLDKNMKNAPFSEGIGKLLVDAPYRQTPPSETDLNQLFALCESWLQTCTKSKP